MTKKMYQITRDSDKLVFRTSSFKAEQTSVLPSGVYSKEFTSMLFASAVCIISYMITDLISSRSLYVRYGLVLLIFVVTFLGSSRYLFKEQYLEATFNRADKTVTLLRSGLTAQKKELIPFANLRSVELGSRKFIPRNIDGIDFVQKISAQHGSAVPGLSDEEEFVTLSLRLADGSERIIFAEKINGGVVAGEPEVPVREIKSFLKI